MRRWLWVGRTEREDNRNRLLNAQRAQFEAQLRINEMLFELATGKRLTGAAMSGNPHLDVQVIV